LKKSKNKVRLKPIGAHLENEFSKPFFETLGFEKMKKIENLFSKSSKVFF
jgi:hypothetical protein